ncbi:CoA transferase [Pseudomonas psychrotolerans L19]|uniref:CoA transferase n=1 Tax=Pseudomonas TaxID=286 RepID=UPI00023A4C1B|nr:MULTISPECIES: CoA transferase [Pseudomonas]EHK72022.1 CoA transferase [Pseudomonas psychrotolerans L19]TCQ83699.1 CoA transferase family III [Pseudomonas sp. JUb52]
MTRPSSTTVTFQSLLGELVTALGLPAARISDVQVLGSDSLVSCFPVSDLATAAIGVAGLASADLLAERGSVVPVQVDRHLAAAWFKTTLRPLGWELPAVWDPITGDYRTRDGWLRLHANAPHHRERALAVLGCANSRDAVGQAMAGWSGEALETALVAAGGCAARLRTQAQWQAHPQGQAVRAEPLIAQEWTAADITGNWRPDPQRPLRGIRVLDLTRILAGPIATRLLAGLGAEVLRIDPPAWDEPAQAPEVTLGKRCARLDLRRPADRQRFESLLAEADVLVHGYRADALERLGYGAAARRALNTGLIDISLCAYGWSGPWSLRRGYDSLVQMSCGVAAAGSAWQGVEAPVPLPVQALDHATGYLMAAAALRGLALRQREGRALTARLSLARTAWLLTERPGACSGPAFGGPEEGDYGKTQELTAWGPALRLRAPLRIGGVELQWQRPATRLGSATADWSR